MDALGRSKHASYSHPQGRIAPGENGVNCEYFIKDHLGSVRVVYADVDRDEVIDFDTVECELLEEHHYYPFGLEMEGMWSDFRTGQYVNRYTYNGKQAQTEMGWDWLNFGKRFYDPLVARFTGTDPKSEAFSNLSPYNFASNTPITNIDIWGLQGTSADILLDRDVKDLQEGRITKEVFWERQIAKGKGAIVALTVVSPIDEITVLSIAAKNSPKIGGAIGRIGNSISNFLDEFLSGIKSFYKGGNKIHDYIDPKFASQLSKNLQEHGESSIKRSAISISNRLKEHKNKLKDIELNGGFTSSVEREINTFERQIETIKQFAKDHNIKITIHE